MASEGTRTIFCLTNNALAEGRTSTRKEKAQTEHAPQAPDLELVKVQQENENFGTDMLHMHKHWQKLLKIIDARQPELGHATLNLSYERFA